MSQMTDEELLRLPWTIAPLEGKYYGTRILDAYGRETATVWRSWDDRELDKPSEREWPASDDWPGDSHYESVGSLRLARLIVQRVNAIASPGTDTQEPT